MIVVDEGDALLLITQPDHAHLAAEILSLCRFPGLLANPRREAVLRATREHDNGWQETDAAPPVDGHGKPHGFTDLPEAMRRELWSRALERFSSTDPYVALLIAQHSLEIHSDRVEREDWADWFAETRALRAELVETAGVEPEAVDADYPFLEFADLCSLAVCSASGQPFSGLETRGRFEDGALRLEPFPLAGTTTFRLSCRRIPKRSYPTTVALGVELATARWETRSVRVAPVES